MRQFLIVKTLYFWKNIDHLVSDLSAKLEEDYSLPERLLTVPEGSVRGTKFCTKVDIFDEYLKEGRESFSIEVSSMSNLTVTFGSGRGDSSSGSVEVIIIDDDGMNKLLSVSPSSLCPIYTVT